MKPKLFIFFITSLLFLSCKKEVHNEPVLIVSGKVITAYDSTTVGGATVNLIVYDFNMNPFRMDTIYFSTVSDNNGYFEFNISPSYANNSITLYANKPPLFVQNVNNYYRLGSSIGEYSVDLTSDGNTDNLIKVDHPGTLEINFHNNNINSSQDTIRYSFRSTPDPDTSSGNPSSTWDDVNRITNYNENHQFFFSGSYLLNKYVRFYYMVANNGILYENTIHDSLISNATKSIDIYY